MNSIKILAALSSAILFTACAQPSTAASSSVVFEEIGVKNAALHGDIGLTEPVSGPTTYAEGWGFEDSDGIDSLILETTKDDGASMILVELFDNRIVSEEIVGHRVTAYGEEASNRVADMGTNEVGVGNIEVVIGEEVYVAECSGPESGVYDYDEQLDNVIVDVQDCEGCDAPGMKIVEVTTWRSGSDKTISGSFEWAPTNN